MAHFYFCCYNQKRHCVNIFLLDRQSSCIGENKPDHIPYKLKLDYIKMLIKPSAKYRINSL